MNIDLKAQAQSLLSNHVGQETATQSNSTTAGAGAPAFGQLLSSQVKGFQERDGKYTVNSAQLLSPNVMHATKMIAKANSHFASHAAQDDRPAEAVDPSKTSIAARAPGIELHSNGKSNTASQIAYAQLAEMQSQGKNMRLLAEGTQLARAPNQVGAEYLMSQTRFTGFVAAVDKFALPAGDDRGQNNAKKSSAPDTAAITAAGITAAEQQRGGQGNSAHSDADPEFTSLSTNTLNTQIHASFGSLQWNEEISQKMIFMISANMHTAVLNLNPENLGPLKIIITVKDQLVDSTFVSNNADVRQTLQDGIDHLRTSMAETGLTLGQADVRSGQSFQESQEQVLASLLPEHRDELSQLVKDQTAPNRPVATDGVVNVFV